VYTFGGGGWNRWVRVRVGGWNRWVRVRVGGWNRWALADPSPSAQMGPRHPSVDYSHGFSVDYHEDSSH
jgi:hypothetical protein